MFAERMMSLMQEKGISKKQMASDVGIGINQIKYWQDNGNVPNALTVERIAKRLDTTPDYLLGKTDQKEKPTADEGDEREELLKLLGKMFTNLSEEQKETVLRYAEFLEKNQ